jgi:uncharacterized protein YlxW (UPF0749 family)
MSTAEEPTPGVDQVGRRRLVPTLLHPRLRRVDIAVAVLVGLLGFAAAVQVRSNKDEGVLASARQEDLVQILDDLNSRSLRLRQEVTTLTATRERLTSGTGQEAAAVAEARRRAQVLGILAGTVAARGPGVLVTVDDPQGKITADVLLDALEELRDSGAEAVQLEGSVDPASNAPATNQVVRVVAGTAFVDDPTRGGIVVGGTLLQPSYRFVVIGDPATISAALAIPGGVLDNVGQRGGHAVVVRRETLLVSALRALDRPRYARPADEPSG